MAIRLMFALAATSWLRVIKSVSLGLVLDRIDLHVEVPGGIQEFGIIAAGEQSAVIHERVESARAQQAERFTDTDLYCNADMGPTEAREFCQLDETGSRLMKSAMSQIRLGARAFHRVLKVDHTIAGLSGSEQTTPSHLNECILTSSSCLFFRCHSTHPFSRRGYKSA